MKKTFLIILLALSAYAAMAQKVTVKKGGTLKQLDGYTMGQYRQCIDNDRLPVFELIPDGKVSRKEKAYDIVGFCAYCGKTYNAFIVADGSKHYVITRDDAVDASALDTWNASFETRHQALVCDVESAADAYIRALDVQYNEAKDFIDRFNEASELALSTAAKRRDSIMNVAQTVRDSLVQVQEEINAKAFNKWKQGLSASTRAAIDKVIILSGGLSSPNSAGGCDATVVYANRTDDVIKYISWTGRAKNAVGDYVRNEIGGGTTFKGRLTGPIEPGEINSATWDCIIYNVTADELVLTSATVTFMNGKVLNLTQADLKAMENMPSKETDIAEEAQREYDALSAIAQREYREVKDSEKVKTTETKLPQNKTFVNVIEEHGSKAMPHYLPKRVYADIYSAYDKINDARIKLQNFEMRYNMSIQDPSKKIFEEFDNKVIKK